MNRFGELIEQYGYDKAKELIKKVGVTAVQAKLLRDYFDINKSNLHAQRNKIAHGGASITNITYSSISEYYRAIKDARLY